MHFDPLSRRTFIKSASVAIAASATAREALAQASPPAPANDKPLRLGIVGSDNSHAEAFSKIANGLQPEFQIPGVRVTHIWGTDPARTQEVAEGGKIEHIAAKREDLIGQVDGVICVHRHGGLHLEDALPFLKAGIPAFVDKPLATSVADATALLDAAEAAKVGFTSFSTLRYAQGTVQFLDGLRANAGELVTGSSTGPADPGSEYGGLFFYGIHALELMHATWGYGIERVRATQHRGIVSAACAFATGPLVTLQLLNNGGKGLGVGGFHLHTVGKQSIDKYSVDSGSSYYDGMQVFVKAMRTGEWPLTRAQLLEPVKVLAAIEESLKTEKEITIV